jgi:transcriptional regulator with XRE-family HTH domain
LTQEELGKLIGVQKAQISKLESGSGNVTIETIVKVISALNAEINFNIRIEEAYLELV